MKRGIFHPDGGLLVTVADDFGRSSSVNRAIAEAYDKGIVTAASLMAGGEAFHEAVFMTRERNQLSAGLHVTLCDGRAVLPHLRIPDLTDADGFFYKDPVKAWLCIKRPFLNQIELEIKAQFDRLEQSGIRPTHVDGHHHLHMHPRIFEMLCSQAARRGVEWIRIPKEPLSIVFRLRSPARGSMAFVEWAVFRTLRKHHERVARKYGLSVARHVYGLSRTDGIDEEYLLDILDHARISLDEIFTHPDTATQSGKRELQALTSARVRERVASLGISLTGYGQLSKKASAFHSAWERL
ncbi:MAG TPA: hypothetical protein DCP92_15160 [Nitrospiraceae bacterium]|jgi:hopanoid biosynthesis associated protein HpnK|nr:hypothetical protein [Nitrospiraceae bacterium]